MKRSMAHFSSFSVCTLFLAAILGLLLVAPPSASMMTGFVVNSTVDSVDATPGDGICADSLARCTLRAAIMEANALAGADTITVPAGTYELTLLGSPFSYDRERLLSAGAIQTSGDLDIVGSDLSIVGASAATTIIQAGPTTAAGIDRIFDINNPKGGPGIGIDVKLENLTLRNGNSPTESPNVQHAGGAIQFDGFNVATGLPKGKLTIRNCVISSNQAAGTGGAIKLSFGSLDIDGTIITSNTSLNASGGGIMFDGGSQDASQFLSITNTEISNNNSPNGTFGNGGGVYASGNANFTLEGNKILTNTAGKDGGGAALIGFNAGRTETVRKNRIENNSAVRGDGVFRDNGTSSVSPLGFTLNVVVGNKSGPNDPTSTGLFLTTNSANDHLENNWWGCNEGPSNVLCDRIGSAIGFAGVPWLVLRHAATPNSILVGQTSTLQADFFLNSSNAAIGASDLVALNGRAITFNNAVQGTISAADAVLNGGKANATFTATTVGPNGSADATVDAATATAHIFVAEAPTITCPANIVTDVTNTQQCNASVTFSASATGIPAPTITYKIGATPITSPHIFSPGVTTVTATATNDFGTATCQFTVTVNDPAPVITCPANIVVAAPANACSTVVNFSVTATDNCNGVTVVSSPASGSVFPVGVTTVTATATDVSGHTSTCTFTVTVTDTGAPVITMNGQSPVFWPPDHSYQTINVTDLVASASDTCDASVDINDVVIAQVSSDEPDDGPADGSTINDIVIAADCKSVQLRAERQANGNGRVYTITFRVRDAAGNTTTQVGYVKVPANGSGGGAVLGPGPGFTVTSGCP